MKFRGAIARDERVHVRGMIDRDRRRGAADRDAAWARRHLEQFPAAARGAGRLSLHPSRSAGRRAIADAVRRRSRSDCWCEAVERRRRASSASRRRISSAIRWARSSPAYRRAASGTGREPDAVRPDRRAARAARERLRDRAATRPAGRHDRASPTQLHRLRLLGDRDRQRQSRRGRLCAREPYAPGCGGLCALLRGAGDGARGADLGCIDCPTLLVTGDEDAVAPPSVAQALADKIEGAKVSDPRSLRPLDADREAAGVRAGSCRNTCGRFAMLKNTRGA